jgi:hypothetical protein
MKKKSVISRRTMLALLSAGPVSLLSSCGTILYPDRVHQRSCGNIDPAVAIMNGVGCLLFLVPGLIAFAVDFYTGAIYFPAGKNHSDKERTIFDETSMYTHPEGKLTRRDIERVVSDRAGAKVNLSLRSVLCIKLSNISQAGKVYTQLANLIYS